MSDRRPVFLNEDGYYVFDDGTPVPEQPVTLRKAFVAGFVTVALVVVLPLMIGFGAYRNIVNDQLDSNEELINRVNDERIARTKAINEFIYEQCLAAEIRDVVIVQMAQADLDRARALLPADSPLLRAQEQTLRDGINALEPPDEPDCRPPSAINPKRRTP